MPLTCTTESKISIDRYADMKDQLSESFATISVEWELTDGIASLSGGFDVIHDYENEDYQYADESSVEDEEESSCEDDGGSEDSDHEYDPRPDIRAVLQGNGEYHRPYTQDYHTMIHVTKIQNGVVESGLHGSDLGGPATVYLAKIEDPEGVLCQALKSELRKAIDTLPDYHKDWFMKILA